MITNNAFIVFECFHKIQHSRCELNTHCGYKLDVAEAYVRVEWNFLRECLTKLEFNQK